ncbi:MAG TPA: DUF4932 domain-containing protein [Bacteroidales bacterium]|nr:DUF4932 domain-containing protein [Bacteroidales bacterium]
MKKILTMLFAVVCFVSSFAQNMVSAKIDERTELLSVIFRLAGNREYNRCMMPSFARATNTYFADYKKHNAVLFAKKLALKEGISFDAPMSFALHLKWDHDTLTLNPDIAENEEYRGRWKQKSEEQFLQLINQFYRETRFHDFFLAQQETYLQAENAMQEILNKIDFKWFETFFVPTDIEKNNNSYNLVISILNGPCNYGAQLPFSDGTRTMLSIMGCCDADENGLPSYTIESVLPTIIHEFCHSYCNPLNMKYWDMLRPGAERVFKEVGEEMSRQAYGHPLIMLNETFVRSSVICYMMAHYPEISLKSLIQDEETNYFVLTQDYVEALQTMEKSREQYPDMHSFMPKLAEIIKYFSFREFHKKQRNELKNCAKITCNIHDGQKNVPAGETEIIISFSKPMRPGIALGYGKMGAEFYPELIKKNDSNYQWSENRQELHVFVKLKPNTRYSFSILGILYYTEDGYKGIGIHYIDFTTGN